MAKPQKENGYTPIANEIMDEVMSRNFTKRQNRILTIVWRFSYGFSKKTAFIGKMGDLAMYGIPKSVVGAELRGLENLNVLKVNWDTGEIEFVKDYESWIVERYDAFDETRHKYLIRLNLHPEERKTVGWNKSRRGGGRPKRLLGLQSINQQVHKM